MIRALLLSCLFAIPCIGQTRTGSASTSAPCSPAITGNNNRVTFENCSPVERGPRLGNGPEAYKDIQDDVLGQWGMEEADKIEELADQAELGRGAGFSYEFVAQRFTNEFRECCAQDVKDLRTEILRRLGPPAKDPNEIALWTGLFPDTKLPNAPDILPNLNVARFYSLYLRRLGLRLKRKTVPRSASKGLHFSEAEVAPDALSFNYNIVASIDTETMTSSGYIVVEFDGAPARMSCDIGSKAPWTPEMLENNELKQYLERLKRSSYILEIKTTKPFTPEKPIQVLASGFMPVHVSKVTLFDE